MAGILLVKPSLVNESAVDIAREQFKKKSFDLREEKFSLGKYDLYYYYDLFEKTVKVHKNLNGDCFFFVGTLIVEGKTGTEALKIIENRLDRGDKIENMCFSGTYILIIYRKENLFISRDLLGSLDCYKNESKSWVTTNFLSAVSLNEGIKFSKYELLEAILFGFVLGYQTIVEGICQLESTKVFNLSSDSSVDKKINIPQIERNHTRALKNSLDILIQEFEGYSSAFPNGKIMSALSGGFDTRLMLALMLEVGITPDLYVYGSDSAKDVIVAKDVAQGEGLPLTHINKQSFPKIPVEGFMKVIESNYFDLDSQYDIFADQSDLDTRVSRAQSASLLLNGAGGGVYRDVWKWDFKNSNLYNMFHNSYNIGHLEKINVDTRDFFKNIEEKMQKKISLFFDIEKKISRQQAEMIFPIYRSRFYAQGNTLNNYFGSATLPFMSEPVILQSFSIPYKFKRYGEFERLLIKKLNPKLASYMSDYGFDFIKGPGVKKKLMERFYSRLSPKIKTKIKSLTTLSSKSLFTHQGHKYPYLKKEYLEQAINPSNMIMDSYIGNIPKIKNQNVLNRIYTYEYLARMSNLS